MPNFYNELLQAYHAADIGDMAFHDYTQTLLSIACCKKVNVNNNNANATIHKLFRDGEVKLTVTRASPTINHTITTYAYAAISDLGKVLVFTYDDTTEYDSLQHFISSIHGGTKSPHSPTT